MTTRGVLALPLLALALVGAFFAGRELPAPPRSPSPAAPLAPKPAGYHCPMHPTVRSDKPGDCPVCGMALVPDDEAPEAGAGAGKVAFYRSTMMPGETSPVPAKDSMGMDMVPVSEDEIAGSAPIAGRVTITASPARRQMIDVRLGTAVRRPFARAIRAAGHVEVDERGLSQVTLKIGGWIEDLHVRAVGETVTAGEPIADIYSPDFVEAHRSHIIALHAVEEAKQRGEKPDESGLRAARDRLHNWDLTDAQIRGLEGHHELDTLMTLLAPRSGTVMKRDVVEGAFVPAGAPLLELADLSTVWVIADIYEYEIAALRVGMDAEVRLDSTPDRKIAAKIDFISPTLNVETRTVSVRLVVPNPDGALRPGMFATATILVDEGEQVVIEDDAVVDTGTRQIVFVDEGDGLLAPREVALGPRQDGIVVVRSGLRAGDRIVTSGTFLVDSESRMRASLRASGDVKAAPAPAGRAQ